MSEIRTQETGTGGSRDALPAQPSSPRQRLRSATSLPATTAARWRRTTPLLVALAAIAVGTHRPALSADVSAATTASAPRSQQLAVADEWSFQPLAAVSPPHRPGQSGQHPIDAFIEASLRTRGLHRSPPAEARNLCRRLYFDLLGLPPSPAEMDQFLTAHAADAAGATRQLIDQLLASPHYGERWARHWLDVVHYGDTHGYDKDKPRPNAWPYRDYVIRAFNSDKPYARFVQEQIAGDVFYPGEPDGIEALGFIAAGPWDFIGHAEVPETKTDGKIARHLDRDDMVANTMGTFVSVTVHCAQCHQHKFDPISQEDYYSLQAVFAAVDRTDKKYFPDAAQNRRFNELETHQREWNRRKAALESVAEKAAGEPLKKLDAEISALAKRAGGNPGAEFGYHSAIASQGDDAKWVQVDLGRSLALERVVLRPAYDDFNNIGAGFGFPRRYRVEFSDDAEFHGSVVLTNATAADVPNPGIKPQVIAAGGRSGRFLRVTATQLAPRSDDFIFALAELEAFDTTGTNRAAHAVVSARDSIEAPPRWQRSNLVDGATPEAPNPADLAARKEQRRLLWEQSLSTVDRAAWSAATNSLGQIRRELDAFPKPRTVYAGGVHYGSGNFLGTGGQDGKPRPIHLLARGQVTQPGRELGPGALAALNFQPGRFQLPEGAPEGDRRAALARWIVDPANPLTWRSIVNRVWQYHFGRGIVATPNDFGRMGAQPSHPELLDWLAATFRDNGGSLKELHRLILNSATYQQAVTSTAEAEAIDSDNRLLWRQNRRKLEAEALRDAVLVVSGKMDFAQGGPGWQDFVVERPEHSPHYEYGLADPEANAAWRRSIYRFIVRSQTQP